MIPRLKLRKKFLSIWSEVTQKVFIFRIKILCQALTVVNLIEYRKISC